MPLRLCLEPRCATPATYRGRCPIHSKERNRETHSSPHRIYSTRRWRLLRRAILTDEPLCRECGTIATDVDHIVPMEEGGEAWAPANCQPMCHECHSAKTNREVRARGMDIRTT